TDREEVLRREQPVTAAGRRMDVPAVPLVTSPPLDGDGFRDGDRLTRLRTVDPDATEETYVRRWGAWQRHSGDDPAAPGPGEGSDGRADGTAGADTVADEEIRRWAAAADGADTVVRHEPRPAADAAAAGNGRRVVVPGFGAMTPLGVGTDALWQGLLQGRHGIRELADDAFDELPVRVAGTVPVDPAELLSRQAARRMNRDWL